MSGHLSAWLVAIASMLASAALAVASAADEVAVVVEQAIRLDNATQVVDTVPPPSTPYRLPVDPDAGPGWSPSGSGWPRMPTAV